VLWFEYDGPSNEGVTDRDTEMAFIRENMPPPHYVLPLR